MSYLVVLYDNNTHSYSYTLSESKSACNNLKNYSKYFACGIYNSKGYFLDSATRLENNKIEKSKCFKDGECRERYAAIYARIKGKDKDIVIGNIYTYKTNLQTDNYKRYYNNKKIKIIGLYLNDTTLNEVDVKSYEGYFLDSPDKATIVVYDINLF